MSERISHPDGVLADRLPATTGLVAAVLAASCCILPISLIALGVASGSLMMTTMRYQWITLPLGVVGLSGAYALYFRNRRPCQIEGCRLVGQRVNQVLLAIATTVVVAALLLRIFPSWTGWLLQQL